jgi:hypothetical protein
LKGFCIFEYNKELSMKSTLTTEESRAIGKLKYNRVVLSLIIAILTIAVISDAVFLVDNFKGGGSADTPEWLVIPVIFGIAALGILIGLSFYIGGRLKDKELVVFASISMRELKSNGEISANAEKKIFADLAKELFDKPCSDVVTGLVSDGWDRSRAYFYAKLVESLIIKCEWNISYQEQAQDFSGFLKKMGWSEAEIEHLVSPVINMIKTSGGRLTRAGIATSIGRNILWIVVILVVAVAAGWLLIYSDSLDLGKKYDYLKFIVLAVPALFGLGFNIAGIVKSLRKKQGNAKPRKREI